MSNILVFPLTVNSAHREVAVDVEQLINSADSITEKHLENACREVAYDRVLSFYIDDYDSAHQDETIILDPDSDYEFQDILGTHTDFYLMEHHGEIMQKAETLATEMYNKISEALWDDPF